MKKKILLLLSVLLVVTLLAAPVAAGGGIKLSGVSFRLGSLVSDGYVSGIGNTDVTVVLDASGVPIVSCVNPAGHKSPGQNPPRVSAVGQQFLPGSTPETKNGKTPFKNVETQDPETLPWDVAGCPNANWTAQIDFILWTDAKITVKSTLTGTTLTSQLYTCKTTQNPDTVSCKPK